MPQVRSDAQMLMAHRGGEVAVRRDQKASTPWRPHTRAWFACRTGFVIGWCIVILSGCNPFHKSRKLEEPISLIAVMPIEAAERPSATGGGTTESLPAEAPHQVTAEVYAVVTSAPEWRVVPDLTVARATRHLDATGDRPTRARAIGKEVKADGVLFGTVSRYVEREGTEYGARRPASVGFELQLISVQSGAILWSGAFEQTQQPLSSNLLRWWQYWRGGPRWFTAQEFTRYGAEHLLKELAGRLQ